VPAYQYTHNASHGLAARHPCRHAPGSSGGARHMWGAVCFCAVVMILGLVLISLFVGVVTDGMSESLELSEDDKLKQLKEKRESKKRKIQESLKRSFRRRDSRKIDARGTWTGIQHCWLELLQTLRYWFNSSQRQASRRSMLHKRFIAVKTTVWVGQLPLHLAKEKQVAESAGNSSKRA
jgi:ABC-type Fe3+ transport system permease subunit